VSTLDKLDLVRKDIKHEIRLEKLARKTGRYDAVRSHGARVARLCEERNRLQDLLDAEAEKAIVNFFTSEVEVLALKNHTKGELVWENRGDGWLYPWRVTRPGYGYPCGEPQKKGKP